MQSNIGNDILNSMGASAFDVGKMSKTLAEASVASNRLNLERSENKFSSKLSGFDTLKFAFNSFKEQVASLVDMSSFQKKSANSSDTRVIDTSITGKPSNGIYQVEVQSLATSHTLASQTEFSSSSNIVGNGDLSFNVGGSISTITIDDTNNTLTGIQNSVNNAQIGVNATIVNVGTGYKLMFSATNSGANNAIDVSVGTDADGNSTDALGLSRLISANMDQTVAAQDAVVAINGLSVHSSSNNIKDVIGGVTLNLKSAEIGSIKTIEISEDIEGLQETIEGFVELFNALDEIIKDLGSREAPDEDDENAITGNLKGDSTLRIIKADIRQAMIDSVPNLSGSIQSLADIGIISKLDGSLEVDKTKVASALASNPEAVGKLFAANATFSDNLVSFKGSTTDTIEGSYNLTVNSAATKPAIVGGAVAGTGITIDATNNTFKVKVNGAESLDLVINAGLYTEENLAKEMARVINNDTNIATAGRVSVSYNGGTNNFTMSSEKYGSSSKLELVSGSFLTSTVAGFGVTPETLGQDVQGLLEQNGNVYTFTGSGQDVVINSILDGSPKGLEFSIGGGATGPRGSVEFNRGYADKLGVLFEQFFEKNTGIIGNRVANITDRLAEIEAEKAKVDARYEKVELKYRLQFGALQSILSNMNSTRESLAASLAIRT